MKHHDTSRLFEQLKKQNLSDEHIVWNGISDVMKDEITRIPIRRRRYKTVYRSCAAAAAVIMLLCAYGVYMSGILPTGSQQIAASDSWYFSDTLSEELGDAEELLLTALDTAELSFDEQISEMETLSDQVSQSIW